MLLGDPLMPDSLPTFGTPAPIATAGGAFDGFLQNLGATFNGALASWVDVKKAQALASAQHGADRLPVNYGPAGDRYAMRAGAGLSLGTILPIAALVLGAALLLPKRG